MLISLYTKQINIDSTSVQKLKGVDFTQNTNILLILGLQAISEMLFHLGDS